MIHVEIFESFLFVRECGLKRYDLFEFLFFCSILMKMELSMIFISGLLSIVIIQTMMHVLETALLGNETTAVLLLIISAYKQLIIVTVTREGGEVEKKPELIVVIGFATTIEK
jgi:hypothetical protein